uniref:Putative anti-sigma regulatory factor, serine/threonine protein kinase n=1 Tax=Cyanothece sp. (strain PCC 7425 / ATCC 29141) TaxID=395961 RepID=B8HJT6_CYAP4
MDINPVVQVTSLQIESNLDDIPTVLSWYDQFNRSPVPHPVWVEGQTALIEGLTNAIRHAHADLPVTTPVEICVKVSSQFLQIQIWDVGAAFDLNLAWQTLTQEMSSDSFDPLNREAHWGNIFLLRLQEEYGWSITYQRQGDDRNCLVMTREL